MEASNILLNRGLPVEFVDYVLTNNAETMVDNINKFEKAFKDAVQVAVDKRISRRLHQEEKEHLVVQLKFKQT